MRQGAAGRASDRVGGIIGSTMSRRWTYAITVVIVAAAVALNILTCSGHGPSEPSPAKPPRHQRDRHMPVVASATRGEMPAGALRLEGMVLDDNDQPMPNAVVQLVPAEVTTKTEADGGFVFYALPGRYYLYADAGDFYSHRTSVQLDATTEPVIIHLVRGSTLVVHVTGDEQPLRGAEVRIEYEDPKTTDENGIARFPGRWPGSFTVRAVAPGYASGLASLEVEPEPRGTVDEVIALERGAPLSGTVVDESGQPVANATLDIERLSDRHRLNATSDAAGAWRVDAVAPGRYHISAKSDQYGPVPAAPLDLDGKSPRTGVAVHVASGGVLVGTITDISGKPMAGVEIDLQQNARVDQFGGKSDAQGHYEVSGLPDGTYMVMRTVGNMMPSVATITIVRGQRIELPIVVDDDHIDGVVVDSKGTPVTGVWVAGDGIDCQDVTDARGHFELVLNKGRPHELVARRHPIDPQSLRGLHDRPSVHVDGSARGVRLVLADEGGVTGRVLLDGRPVTSYALVVEPASNDRFPEDATLIRSADGRFAKRELPTGTWVIKVTAQGCEPAKSDGVVIEADKVRDIGDIMLRRGLRVSGHVYDSSGVRVSGARVSAGWPGEETTTDASGAYVLDAVPRDSRRSLRASHPTLGVSEEHVLGAAETTVDLTLSPVGGIDGVIDGFRGDQTSLAARRQDGPGGGQAEIDRAGEFHFDGLPAGTYAIAEDLPSGNPPVKPFTVTVEPFRRVHVRAVIDTNTVTVLARVVSSCTEVVFIRRSDDSGGEVASFQCTKDVKTLRYIAPGAYRACDWSERCTTITVAATPPTQSIDISFENPK